jgi:hypothetical protein
MVFEINYVKRDGEDLANPPGVIHPSLAPKPHGDANDLITFLLQQRCGEGGIHTAAHRHRNTIAHLFPLPLPSP